MREAVIGARVDELQAASAFIRPIAPVAARGVGHFFDDDVHGVGLRLAHGIRGDADARHGQRETAAAIRERAFEIPVGVVGIEIGIVGQHPADVVGHHDVTVRRDAGVGREFEINARSEAPARKAHRGRALVVEFHILVVLRAGDGLVHDLVDDDIMDERRAVGAAGCARGHRVKLRGPIGEATGGNIRRLCFKPDAVEHPQSIRRAEIDGLAAGVQAEVELGLIHRQEPARGDGGVRREGVLVRVRIIGKRAARKADRLVAVIVELDVVLQRRLGGGEEFIDEHVTLRRDGEAIRCAR